MAITPVENVSKPLLQDYEGTSYDAEDGGEKGGRASCMPPSITKLDLLEAFDNGPVGVLQTDSQTILNIVRPRPSILRASFAPYALSLLFWFATLIKFCPRDPVQVCLRR